MKEEDGLLHPINKNAYSFGETFQEPLIAEQTPTQFPTGSIWTNIQLPKPLVFDQKSLCFYCI